MNIKIAYLIIVISLFSCNASIVVLKGDNNDINTRQKIDSLQLQKNNRKLLDRWLK